MFKEYLVVSSPLCRLLKIIRLLNTQVRLCCLLVVTQIQPSAYRVTFDTAKHVHDALAGKQRLQIWSQAHCDNAFVQTKHLLKFNNCIA